MRLLPSVFRRAAPRGARVPDGQRVYAVGDVHGRLDLLDRMLGLIAEDAAAAPRGTASTIVMLGDYVDRGPDGAGVLERLSEGPPPGFGLVCLRGNHDDALLGFLEDGSGLEAWLRFGGGATLASYGVRPPAPDRAGPDAARAALAELRAAIPGRHVDLLRTLPFRLPLGGYLFVHAGVRPGVPEERQSPQDMMWIRDEFLRSGADHGRVVVHGHTVVDAPEVRRNRIGIDTGAYASGRLTALVLEGASRRFLRT